jgi:hypothetical protein
MPNQYDKVAELTLGKGNIFWKGLLNRSVAGTQVPGRAGVVVAEQMHAIVK